MSGEGSNRAGGVSFDITGYGNRFFVWHSDHDKLHVREPSFSEDISNNSIEFRFSNSKVLNCGIYCEPTGIFVLVCTSDGVYQKLYVINKKVRFRC